MTAAVDERFARWSTPRAAVVAKVPTARQLAVLRYVHEFAVARGMPPTLREIGAAFSIRSTNGVSDHLRALERRGLVEHIDCLSRSVRLTPRGRALLGLETAQGPDARDEVIGRLRALVGRAAAFVSEIAPASQLAVELRAESLPVAPPPTPRPTEGA